MTNPISTGLRRALDALAAAVRHAPLEVAMAVGIAIAAMVAIHGDGSQKWFAHVVSAAALAFPLLLALSAAATRDAVSPAVRWGGSAAVLVGAALYGAFVVDPDLEAEGWRLGSFVAASVCVLVLAPHAWRVGDGQDRRRLWRFNAVLLVRKVTALLYGGALMAALSGAVAAVDNLFELDIPGDLYGDLAAAIFLALVPALIAGGLADATAEPPESREPPVLVRVLGRWLYALIVVIYLAILVAYCVKVVSTGELPKNLLSPLVLFAGLFGLVGAAYLDPVHESPDTRVVSAVARGFPLVLVLLVPVALWAVWTRLADHGWTEFRYLRFVALLALGLLGILGTIRLVRRRPPLLAAVPLTLGAVALLSAFGPWSAQSVSRRDQRARLERALHDAGLARGGLPLVLPETDRHPDAPTIPAETYDRLYGTVAYLGSAHGPEALHGLVTAPDSLSAWQVAARLPVLRGCEADTESLFPISTAYLDETGGIAVPAGTLHVFEGVSAGAARPSTGGALKASLDTLGVLQLSDTAAGGWTAAVDLRPLAARYHERRERCGERSPRAEAKLAAADSRIAVTDAAGRTRGVVILRRMTTGRAEPRGGPAGPARATDVAFVLVMEPGGS